ncbi:MAG: ATP-binding cassette domain-containing protein [Bacteroidetes bacterium]|nr:ATP-binding cassette domain-containing protein [Bacteroidota bacterium]
MKLRAEQLVKKYKQRTVVNNVSIEVSQGEIVGLLGPNGAGKTTSFYMIVGLIKPNEGEIFLENEKITDLPMYKRAQRGIGYLAQEASVFRKLSVEDNIKAVLELTSQSKRRAIKKTGIVTGRIRITKNPHQSRRLIIRRRKKKNGDRSSVSRRSEIYFA